MAPEPSEARTMAAQNSTLNKLQIIEMLYRHGYQSEVIDRALDKIFTIEGDSTLRELAQLEARLEQFEVQHRMSSDEYYRRFQQGELGDSADFFEWSAFCDMANAVRTRLKDLETEMA